jgi:hypothetical protein
MPHPAVRLFCVMTGSVAITALSGGPNILFSVSQMTLFFYLTYLKKVLETASFGLQTNSTCNKYIVHCVLECSLWNWKHYILNALYQIICTLRIITILWSCNMPHKLETYGFRSSKHGGHNPLLVLGYRKHFKNSIELFMVRAVVLCYWK